VGFPLVFAGPIAAAMLPSEFPPLPLGLSFWLEIALCISPLYLVVLGHRPLFCVVGWTEGRGISFTSK